MVPQVYRVHSPLAVPGLSAGGAVCVPAERPAVAWGQCAKYVVQPVCGIDCFLQSMVCGRLCCCLSVSEPQEPRRREEGRYLGQHRLVVLHPPPSGG